MHRAFYIRDKLDAVLVPLPAEDVGDAIGIAETLGLKGLAVTIPHKESLLRFLDEKQVVAGIQVPLLRNGFRLVVFSIVIMIVVLFFRRGIMGTKELPDLFRRKEARS